jgi:tryptophanyl-tRNA synthetase
VKVIMEQADSTPSKQAARRRALTGIKPTGTPHIGNLMGMYKPAIALSRSWDAFYFIADFHALTTLHDPAMLRSHTLEVAATWLALGLDPAKSVLFRQSDVPEVCEMAWLLSCVTGLGFLQRAHAYKDAVAQGKEINAGTFFYPVLMAADILAYDSNGVPVGRDQKQHVEMARDMAIMFNHTFGDCLVVPEPIIQDEVATVKGLDGRKMSKSYDNTIPLFLPPKKLKALVMRIVTDPTPLEEPKDPEHCTVFDLYRLFASPEQVDAMARRYRAGGFGYGHAKLALFDAMEEALREPRERYDALMASPRTVEEVLAQGASRARSVASTTLFRMRNATGL